MVHGESRGTWCQGQAEPLGLRLSLDIAGVYPREPPEPPGWEKPDRYAVGDW